MEKRGRNEAREKGGHRIRECDEVKGECKEGTVERREHKGEIKGRSGR